MQTTLTFLQSIVAAAPAQYASENEGVRYVLIQAAYLAASVLLYLAFPNAKNTRD